MLSRLLLGVCVAGAAFPAGGSFVAPWQSPPGSRAWLQAVLSHEHLHGTGRGDLGLREQQRLVQSLFPIFERNGMMEGEDLSVKK